MRFFQGSKLMINRFLDALMSVGLFLTALGAYAYLIFIIVLYFIECL